MAQEPPSARSAGVLLGVKRSREQRVCLAVVPISHASISVDSARPGELSMFPRALFKLCLRGLRGFVSHGRALARGC